MSALRIVYLLGELGRKFGRRHLLAISTPAEAIRALMANFPDFAAFMVSSSERGVGYRVTVDKEVIDDLGRIHDPFSRAVRIAPMVSGAKSGIGSILIGAALITAAIFSGGALAAPLFTVGAFAPSVASIAFGLGASLVLGGVSQLLSPQPKAQDPREATENQPSYVFNGPVNTTQQGQCVPVGYGRLIVGSAVISAGITADEYGAAGVE